MLIAKWGNSLAVRLPAAVVEALELREGDDNSIHVVNPGQRVDAASRSRIFAFAPIRATGMSISNENRTRIRRAWHEHFPDRGPIR